MSERASRRPAAAALLEVRGLRKTFPGVVALDNVDFDLRHGEVHALLGANGAGKSTLIKIVAGLHRADAGEIRIDGEPAALRDTHAAKQAGVSVIYQEPALVPQLSVAENLFLGRELTTRLGLIDWRRTHDETRRLLDRVGSPVATDTLVSRLSTAQRQLVEIAKALGTDAKLLILDEPTAALSSGEAEGLFALVRTLARSGVGVIYVSHRLEEVAALVDRVTVLRDGRSLGTWPVRALDRAKVVSLITGQDLPHVPAKACPRPDRGWVRFADQGHAERQESTARLAFGESRDDPLWAGRAVVRTHAAARRPAGPALLELRHLGRAGEFENISLVLRAGEILVLTGLIGAGRTELLETVFGARRAEAGEIRRAGKPVTFSSPRDAIGNGIALIPEDRRGQGLAVVMPVFANITLASLDRFVARLMLSVRQELEHADRMIRELAIRTPSPFRAAGSLSGGNQQKLVLAKWLSTSAEVFLFDEPTQGVDVGAKDEIYRLIRDIAASGKGVIVVSSDLEEVLEIGDRILAMRQGRIVGEFLNEGLDPSLLVDAITHGRAA